MQIFPKFVHSSTFDLFVKVIIVFALIGSVILGCKGLEIQRLERIETVNRFIQPNENKVKILFILSHEYGSTVVVEGVISKERKSMDFGGCLPAPGEIWEIAHNDTGYLIFVKKVE